MNLSEVIEILKYNDKQNIREMSEDERDNHKRMKKKKRRVVVKLQKTGILATLVLVVVIVVGVNVLKHSNSKAEEKPSNNETNYALTVAGANVAPVEDVEIVEEPVPMFSAVETENTASIYMDDVISTYGIIINNDTNEIVATRNAYDRMNPASMTKVMTVYTARKHLSDEQLDQKVVLSDEAVAECYKAGCSTSGFVAGEEVTVRDLFYGTILPSGGDAAAQLAITTAGSIDAFMELVNADLADLGLAETTHFTNPIGCYATEHYSTAYDIAMILKASLEDDFLREVLSTKVYYSTATNVNPEGIIISNWFLRRIEDKDIGGEILGAKTGYVNESGSCAVSSMIAESGTTYICCTGKSTSSWNCIADHVKIYKTFAK